MKRISLIFTIFLIYGCATVVYEAPPGKEVYISGSYHDKKVIGEGTHWYLVSGLIPITSNRTSTLPEGIFSTDKNPRNAILNRCPNGSEVAFKTESNIVDIFISLGVRAVIGSFTFGALSWLSPHLMTTTVYCK
ncbi:MAG: hypothetical protein GXO39_02140 [Thermotogae bacterium]|nr:hypothetical protein [Thermotogota bacterium]